MHDNCCANGLRQAALLERRRGLGRIGRWWLDGIAERGAAGGVRVQAQGRAATEQRRAAPVIAYLPWARIVCEVAQDYKCDLTYEAAVFAAMYKLVEAKIVGVLAAAGAIAQNAGRMYVCENDVTLAKKLSLKPGRRHR